MIGSKQLRYCNIIEGFWKQINCIVYGWYWVCTVYQSHLTQHCAVNADFPASQPLSLYQTCLYSTFWEKALRRKVLFNNPHSLAINCCRLGITVDKPGVTSDADWLYGGVCSDFEFALELRQPHWMWNTEERVSALFSVQLLLRDSSVAAQ